MCKDCMLAQALPETEMAETDVNQYRMHLNFQGAANPSSMKEIGDYMIKIGLENGLVLKRFTVEEW